MQKTNLIKTLETKTGLNRNSKRVNGKIKDKEKSPEKKKRTRTFPIAIKDHNNQQTKEENNEHILEKIGKKR